MSTMWSADRPTGSCLRCAWSTSVIPNDSFFGALKQQVLRFWSCDPLTLAASIAFYTALSFAPMVMVSLWAMATLGSAHEIAFVDQLKRLFGAQVGVVAEAVVGHASGQAGGYGRTGIASLALLLVSATTAFAQLHVALNRIWGTPAPRNNAIALWLLRRLFSLGMVAVLAFLLSVSLVVSSLLSLLQVQNEAVWLINEVTAVTAFAAIFGGLYRYVPEPAADWDDAGKAGIITAVLFELGKWGLGLSLDSMTTLDAYGAATSVILLLLWVYYSAAIVLLGASFIDFRRPVTRIRQQHRPVRASAQPSGAVAEFRLNSEAENPCRQ